MKLPILDLGQYFSQEFKKKVFKISVDPGFSCPNRDGTLGTGGCIYCNNDAFVPPNAESRFSAVHQFEAGIRRIRKRVDAYLPYIHAYTATHAPIQALRPLYRSLQEHPQSFGLALSTRPDCLAPQVLDLIDECNRRSFFWLEVGVQSLHDPTLKLINRGHAAEISLQTLAECKRRGIPCVAHLIVGLPGETRQMMLETLEGVVEAGVAGIKFHPLHVVRGSPLAAVYGQSRMHLQTQEEYVSTIVELLERVPPQVIIHRLVADAAAGELVAPKWMLDKVRVLDLIGEEFTRRGSRQGSRVG